MVRCVSLLPGGFKANDVTERQLCGYVYFLLYITVKLVRRGWACLVQYGPFVRKSSLSHSNLHMLSRFCICYSLMCRLHLQQCGAECFVICSAPELNHRALTTRPIPGVRSLRK